MGIFDALWITPPNNIFTPSSTTPDGEKFFHKQMDDITNEILLDDSPHLKFNYWPTNSLSTLNWIGRGEVIAGSSISQIVNSAIEAKDVDIYFQDKDDAQLWLTANSISMTISPKINVCCRVDYKGIELNLIWGIEYLDVHDLLSGFDIRACAIAFDPSTNQFVACEGTIEDCLRKRIVFHSKPRCVSVARLLKYIDKKFTIDKWQRAIFAELIKNGKHSTELELITNYAK